MVLLNVIGIYCSCLSHVSTPRSRALVIYKECLGPAHNDVGSATNLLAVVVGEQGRYLEVRPNIYSAGRDEISN